jgi:hypothetical protein
MAKVEASRSNKQEVAKLKAFAADLEKGAANAKTPAEHANRMKALAAILNK